MALWSDLDVLGSCRSDHIRRAITEYILRVRYDPEGKLIYELAQRALAQGWDFIAEYVVRSKRR